MTSMGCPSLECGPECADLLDASTLPSGLLHQHPSCLAKERRNPKHA